MYLNGYGGPLSICGTQKGPTPGINPASLREGQNWIHPAFSENSLLAGSVNFIWKINNVHSTQSEKNGRFNRTENKIFGCFLSAWQRLTLAREKNTLDNRKVYPLVVVNQIQNVTCVELRSVSNMHHIWPQHVIHVLLGGALKVDLKHGALRRIGNFQ